MSQIKPFHKNKTKKKIFLYDSSIYKYQGSKSYKDVPKTHAIYLIWRDLQHILKAFHVIFLREPQLKP